MTRPILLALLFLHCGLACALAKEPANPAEKVVAAFSQDIYSQHWAEAAALMAPDALEQFHRMFVHIANTPKDEKDGQEFLRMFGLSSVEELEAMKPEAFFAKMFTVLFPVFSKDTQKMWLGTTVEIVGSVAERDDLVHVVIRTRCEVQSAPISVVSVASVQQLGPDWKVLLTAEMQAMLTKLKRK